MDLNELIKQRTPKHQAMCAQAIGKQQTVVSDSKRAASRTSFRGTIVACEFSHYAERGSGLVAIFKVTIEHNVAKTRREFLLSSLPG